MAAVEFRIPDSGAEARLSTEIQVESDQWEHVLKISGDQPQVREFLEGLFEELFIHLTTKTSEDERS